ncbi:hypothetical protein [Ferroglobus placidus]|nr:hypothetical protein [Ferroglobus placidus]
MKELIEFEKFLGLSLIIFRIFLIIAGVLIYLLPQILGKGSKLAENPLIIFPTNKEERIFNRILSSDIPNLVNFLPFPLCETFLIA